MMEASGGHDDLTAGIFGDSAFETPQTEPKEFKPWHKPRKQFVRREQLSALLQRLYEDRAPEDPLRYLGLPGTDLIDLRYLYDQLCRSESRPLRFLGFNTEAQRGNPAHVQLNISLDEVSRLPNVDPQSEVIHDDFRQIGDSDSIAWDRTLKHGPFDVVNIDLCDGLASDPPGINRSIYRAIDQLTAFQARNPTPWLLLVSTRIGRERFDSEAEDRLMVRFRENVDTCDGFAEAWEELLKSDVKSIDPATCSALDFLNLMIVAIGKWLSALAQTHGRSRVELASTQGYRVEAGSVEADLVSLAFRVNPVIEASPDALSPTPSTPEDECTTAKAILRRSTRRLDVDTILEQRPDLFEELISETERLLSDARYETAGYRQWLET
ncbi:MAG: hypothetical protein F4Y63_08490 [Chloroflexi bacterium]|nr:hypothetical protein [Chloroflexota bacterium]